VRILLTCVHFITDSGFALSGGIVSSGYNKHKSHPQVSRLICLHFKSEPDLEYVASDLLDKELKDKDTPVLQYGTEGHVLWVEGKPGRALRKIADDLIALGWIRTDSQGS